MKIALDTAAQQNKISRITDDIVDAKPQSDGAILMGQKGTYKCQQLILATGFEGKLPGGGFISQTIDEFGLQTAACGFPAIPLSLSVA